MDKIPDIIKVIRICLILVRSQEIVIVVCFFMFKIVFSCKDENASDYQERTPKNTAQLKPSII